MTTADFRGSKTPRPERLERAVTAVVVFGSALFVFWQMHPNLIFTNSTPTGGDMGAHVWGPAFLRDELLPKLSLTGWTPDWYGGFPAFHFYMVIPALMIVVLDVGLHPVLSIPIVLGLLGSAVYTRFMGRFGLSRRLTIALCIAAPLLISLPYNIAFKLVAISGIVMFPVAGWALGHLGGLRYPGPAILSVASLAFAFDRSFNIYGGNIASTLAGEFANSISLSLALVALGFVIRGTRTGEYRGWAAVFIALTGLTHLLPAFFLLGATFLLMVIRVAQRRWSSVPWLFVAGGLSAMLSAFWVLPFAMRTAFLNDMGWERIEIIHSPLVTRSILNPSDVLSDYPPLPVLLVLAAVGLVLSLVDRVELGPLLGLTAGLMALGFVYFPDGRLWNARILPFYYLSVTLLAGVGVALLIKHLSTLGWPVRLALFASSVILLLPTQIRDAWVWPEPSDETSYLGPAAGYAVRVLVTTLIIGLVGTEIPRQLGRHVRAPWVIAAVVAFGLLVASPAREISTDSLGTLDGLVWALVALAAIATLLFVAISFMTRFVAHTGTPNAAKEPELSAKGSDPSLADPLPAEPGPSLAPPPIPSGMGDMGSDPVTMGSDPVTMGSDHELTPPPIPGASADVSAFDLESPWLLPPPVPNPPYVSEPADLGIEGSDPMTPTTLEGSDPTPGGAPNARTAELTAPLVVAGVLFVLLGLALNAVGGTTSTDAGRSWSFAGLDVTSDDNSFVRGWARWNFSGLEAKPRSEGAIGDVGQGGYEEYEYVQRTMLGVGEQVGCGRAMWEFAPELNRYGTTMAMMLMPMWTDSCIGSMEGLYFEATPTVPYHFLVQSDLSAPSRKAGETESVGGPSRAMRDLPYSDFDIDRGVDRMHEMGARYYMAFSPQTVEAARQHPDLTEVTTASPWVVFETSATLVEPLAATPVVIDGVSDAQDEWLDVGVEWFADLDAVRPASSGPDTWARVAASEVLERYEREGTDRAGDIGSEDVPLREVLPADPVETSTSVSNVLTETDKISFSVDQIGTPVLVRTSYFPNWQANGAEGPFRVAPNFMVVVPTETDVELVYARTGLDWLAIALTFAGFVGLIVLAKRTARP